MGDTTESSVLDKLRDAFSGLFGTESGTQGDGTSEQADIAPGEEELVDLTPARVP